MSWGHSANSCDDFDADVLCEIPFVGSHTLLHCFLYVKNRIRAFEIHFSQFKFASLSQRDFINQYMIETMSYEALGL